MRPTPRPLTHRRGAARPARGFTLIEIMVALAIGLVILLAMSVMYARNSSNFSEIEKTGDLLENARYALDVMTEDAQQAGFYSEINPGSLGVTWNDTADPCATDATGMGWDTSTSAVTMPVAVHGYTSSDTVTCLDNRLAGTPAVTMRHSEGDTTVTTAGVKTGNVYLQVSRCESDTRVIVASSTATDFTLQNIGCTGVIDELRRFMVRTYYVSSCSDCPSGTPGDGIPTLKRAELVDGQIRITPIAEGIEKAAFEYGVDVDGDGKPDEFIDASQMGTSTTRLWRNVVSVRMTLLARARTPTQNYTDPRTYTIEGVAYTPADAYKRTLLTSTVRLLTVAGRLEK